ncbi:hypothetical protein AMJ80_05195 [bacterium SM23_31]|nr:MAG: hypothetical protein AMJ80_05195 [bacterium SM23_31]
MNSDDYTTEPVVIFKTGKIFELDMVTNVLQEKGIPFYTQEESLSGIKLAMSLQPTMGPGIWYSVLVPEKAAKDAKFIISELPIDIGTNPDIWDFGPSKVTKRSWKIFAWSVLLIFALMCIKLLCDLSS